MTFFVFERHVQSVFCEILYIMSTSSVLCHVDTIMLCDYCGVRATKAEKSCMLDLSPEQRTVINRVPCGCRHDSWLGG